MGVGRKLYEFLFNELRNRGFYSAYAGITLPNEQSVNFHKPMGFQKIGVYEEVGFKFGGWHDVSWWGLNFKKNHLALKIL